MNISGALRGQLIAVKTLETIFWILFRKLTNCNLIIVNCMSVSAMTALSIVLLWLNLIWLAVLFSNFEFYDFNETGFQKNLKIFLDVSELCDTFEILSHYSKNDSSYWHKKTFIGSQIKFSEKNLLFNWLLLFLLTLFYWIFGFCCCCFHSDKTCCDVILITHAWQTSLYSHWGIFEGIDWLPSKSIEINAC